MLTHFDHVTLAVRSVDAALADYQRILGSAPLWQGHHPELGTRAAIFGFANAALELVGPAEQAGEADTADDDHGADGMRAWLDAHGEGLQALAFGTSDAAACSRTLRERGLRATPPQAGQAHAADGGVREYRTVELSPRSARGLSVLAVERAEPRVLFASRTPALDCVDALDHIVLRTADPDAAIALYGDGLGLRLALDREIGGTRMLFFRVGGVTLEVVHDPALGPNDTLYGLAYRVRDLAATHARLQSAGVAVSEPRAGAKPGTQVLSVRGETHGVPTLIIRDPARD